MTQNAPGLPAGAHYLGSRKTRFLVWAPKHQTVAVHQVHPFEKTTKLEAVGGGYFSGVLENVEPGCRYFYRLGDVDRPDPASRCQPEGVHGPSEVVGGDFSWKDQYWCGIPLQDFVLYELHVGTFTKEGTFDAAARQLPRLKDLGITAVELMPVAQFPGQRNWGYDGVFPYAVQSSYGGPLGMKRFVDACHHEGLAVVQDVVYNHLGPEGNYFSEYGHYFTDRYRSPWGPGINFDGPDSDAVRKFFLDNVRFWYEDMHVDGLRLDAIDMIVDNGAPKFMEGLTATVQEYSRRSNRLAYAIAETAANDPAVLKPREMGGAGMDAQWNDDFHHALHALITGEDNGYYADHGSVESLAKAYREGYVLSGQYSHFRRRSYGKSSADLPARKFFVYSQNHDQVGNRPRGDRVAKSQSLEAVKLAAGATLLSPYLPLLFMGEEYGETNPFYFFTDHSNAGLDEAVRRNRRAEFEAFHFAEDFPDPSLLDTYTRCILDLEKLDQARHRGIWDFYKELLRLRRGHPALRSVSKDGIAVSAFEEEKVLFVSRQNESARAWMAFHFGDLPQGVRLPAANGRWARVLDSADPKWGGGGLRTPEILGSDAGADIEMSPRSFILYEPSKGA